MSEYIVNSKIFRFLEAMVTQKTGPSKNVSHGVGRRKASVARVWTKPGKGVISVNGKEYKNYFDTELSLYKVTLPLKVAGLTTSVDVKVNVFGGGLKGQAEATQLGIARALLVTNETLRKVLRQNNLLTVDSRIKERKKYGQKAARRKFQFVKR
jgi:small subunit ribosomal protein S9